MRTSISHPPNHVDKKIRPAIKENELRAEEVWTYLVARKYENDHQALVSKLCGTNEKLPKRSTIWLESYLFPTRTKDEEQNCWKTRSDMAIGHLELEATRKHQIRSNGKWVCIAESKWFADIHANSKYPEINQLAQIIDHALLLHDKEAKFPERVYVTLVTPKYFKEKLGKFSDRIYWKKYNEYKFKPEKLKKDLRLCPLPFLKKHSVETLISRIRALNLSWVTFEELLGLPNLVEDNIPGKYRVTRQSWKQIFSEMGTEDLYRELS
jgi:hypothetical protein